MMIVLKWPITWYVTASSFPITANVPMFAPMAMRHDRAMQPTTCRVYGNASSEVPVTP